MLLTLIDLFTSRLTQRPMQPHVLQFDTNAINYRSVNDTASSYLSSC